MSPAGVILVVCFFGSARRSPFSLPEDTVISTPTTPVLPTVLGAREKRVIWLLLGAAFVAILNETTMGIAIPNLITTLGITTATAQWLTTAFMLTMAVVIPITGFLLQRFTTRQIFITAMTLFSLGTLMAVLAPGFWILITARVVQALGTAIMMPLLMTTMMNVVPPHLRGQMMGRVSIVMALAPAIGPTLSGILVDAFSWRANFIVMLPIAIIALLVGARWITNLGEPREAPIDMLSVVLSALGFGGLVFGLSQISGEGGSSARTVLFIALGVGVVGLALFVWRQLLLQRRDIALLDLRVFASKNFTLSVVQFALLSLAFFGAMNVLPLYLQDALLLEPKEAGLVVLPGSLIMATIGPVIGRVYDRSGTRVLLIPGAVIVLGMLWFYTTFNAHTPVAVVAIAQTILSIGLALSFTPLFTASLGSLEPKLYSYGSAVVGTTQQVAGAAGVALLVSAMSSVQQNVLAAGKSAVEASAAGTHASFLLAACIAIPVLIAPLFIRKPEDDLPEHAAGH